MELENKKKFAPEGLNQENLAKENLETEKSLTNEDVDSLPEEQTNNTEVKFDEIKPIEEQVVQNPEKILEAKPENTIIEIDQGSIIEHALIEESPDDVSKASTIMGEIINED